jgi:hypothetical protein
MARRGVAPALAIACFVVSSFGAARAGSPVAVLELFTSQGCSSCPPADRLVGQLSNDPSLIALSIPIDYWDYLGWRDTLANPAHSARQRAYARARGDGQVYTPQIVVNGATDALGSDQGSVERAIAQANHKNAAMSLPVHLSVSNGALTVNVIPADNSQGEAQAALQTTAQAFTQPSSQSAAQSSALPSAEVWLCPLSKSVAVAIGRGENRGRTVTYHNVVRNWVKLGNLSATQTSWNVPIAQIRPDGIDAAAVVVQEGTRERPGVILGAALTDLR